MANREARGRRERAARAAAELGAAYGVESAAPAVLKDSNNTVVHLAPSPVVAKVATSARRDDGPSRLAHELSVALHLAARRAPVVTPSDLVPAVVHCRAGLDVTFWRYCPGETRDDIDRPELFAAVARFHEALSDYAGPLPPFTEAYDECRALLDGGRLSAELSAADRRLLRRVHDGLRARLDGFDFERVPVHTEIHGGNVLWVGAEPLLIDFESCCLGPRELDLLPFAGSGLAARVGADERLSEVLSLLKSFTVAVRCWAQPGRAPEVREAAEYHLARLRAEAAGV